MGRRRVNSLLQWESAQWDRTQAYNDTKAMLVTHPDVDGVWTANDDMAMGAIQALKEAGLAGKVLVSGCDGIPEMFAAIEAGLAAATTARKSGRIFWLRTWQSDVQSGLLLRPMVARSNHLTKAATSG